MELCLNRDIIKKWRRITKKAKEAAKRGELFDSSTMLEVTFVRSLIQEFLEVLSTIVVEYCGYRFNSILGFTIHTKLTYLGMESVSVMNLTIHVLVYSLPFKHFLKCEFC